METVWRGMESAPKDESFMWLDYGDGRLTLGRWVDMAPDAGFWRAEAVIEPAGRGDRPPRLYIPVNYTGADPAPRAWMKLPLPPLVEEEAA